MPPEQCIPDSGEIGPASDVFGLGATLFHAVSGQKPFPHTTDERFPQLTEEPLPLPEWIPAELAGLIERMLGPDPADRPLAADVAAELKPLVADLPRRMTFSRRGIA